MENKVIRHPQADELNRLEDIKRKAKLENNKAMFDEANNQIKKIIKENEFQIPNNFRELPLENQRDIVQIKINESIVLRDEELTKYWTSILHDIENKIDIRDDEKRKQEEKVNQEENENKNEKENIQIENKQEEVSNEKEKKEKEIKKTRKGEKTLITYYKDGDIRVNSDYMSIKTAYPNTKIIPTGFGISLALADIGAFDSVNEELEEIMNSAKTEDDFNALLDYANNIKIGTTGNQIATKIENYVKEKKQQIEKNNEVQEEIKGELTTYTKTNDTIKLTSDYLTINIDTNNEKLHEVFEILQTQIALIDVGKGSNKNLDYAFGGILSNTKTEQDKNDVLNFAKNINIGTSGQILSTYLETLVNDIEFEKNNENQEEQEEEQTKNINQTSVIDKITKKRDLLDMQLDEIMQAQPVETDDLYMISKKYNRLSDEAASYISNSSISTEERILLEDIMTALETKAESIRITADKAEELGNALSY